VERSREPASQDRAAARPCRPAPFQKAGGSQQQDRLQQRLQGPAQQAPALEGLDRARVARIERAGLGGGQGVQPARPLPGQAHEGPLGRQQLDLEAQRPGRQVERRAGARLAAVVEAQPAAPLAFEAQAVAAALRNQQDAAHAQLEAAPAPEGLERSPGRRQALERQARLAPGRRRLAQGPGRQRDARRVPARAVAPEQEPAEDGQRDRQQPGQARAAAALEEAAAQPGRPEQRQPAPPGQRRQLVPGHAHALACAGRRDRPQQDQRHAQAPPGEERRAGRRGRRPLGMEAHDVRRAQGVRL
jgi:hypothetical protein